MIALAQNMLMTVINYFTICDNFSPLDSCSLARSVCLFLFSFYVSLTREMYVSKNQNALMDRQTIVREGEASAAHFHNELENCATRHQNATRSSMVHFFSVSKEKKDI